MAIQSADMCGIFGIVFDHDERLGSILIEAGRRLAYRGYDSVGFAAIPRLGAIDLRKDVGKVDETAKRLNADAMTGRMGITQLRWATFGTPSKPNAQPHLDSDGSMVGAHNGNVVNNVELREAFAAEGMTVRSTNDGESCVHAVERYRREGKDLVTAARMATRDLHGDYAFVIGDREGEMLVAVRMGSGLVAGVGDGFACVSSDLPSILGLTRSVVRLRDGEMCLVKAGSVELLSVEDGSPIARPIEESDVDMEQARKGGYAHFMLKEIHEQPKVASDLLHLYRESKHVDPFLDDVRRARRLYLVGCGTSFHACLVGAVYLGRLAGIAAIPVLAPQFRAQYGEAVSREDVGIFVSQSGETKDVLDALALAKRRGMHVLALANVLGSSLMTRSDRYLPLACGYEVSVPATKTFVNQVLAFLLLARRLSGQGSDLVADLPRLLGEGIAMAESHVESLANELADCADLYCLGYGLTYGIALEGALKLKEITYAHCEGMLSTEFKHGPLSAVSEGFPVLYVAGKEDIPLMVSAVNEVSCRGGRALCIASEDERLSRNAHLILRIPKADSLLEPLLAVLPLQLLAYRMALARGNDPDFPRNLSKTLTVD